VPNNTVAIPTLGTDPPVTLTLERTGQFAFVLTSPDGGEAIRLRDVGFGILAATADERRAAWAAVRRDVDMTVESWRRVGDRIVALKDPVARFDALMTYRQRSPRSRYTNTKERWRKEHRIAPEDLRASLPDVVLNHLRIEFDGSDKSVRHGAEYRVNHSDDAAPARRSVWDRAAETLIVEEGFETAFERFAGLPIPMPTPIIAKLEAQDSEGREKFARRLLSTPTSPVGAAHALRVLALFGEKEALYRRLAWRLMRRAAGVEFDKEVQLLRLVATEAIDSLRFRSENAASATNDALSASLGLNEDLEHGTEGVDGSTPVDVKDGAESGNVTGRGTYDASSERVVSFLLAGWHHAHHFVTDLLAIGGSLDGILEFLKGRASGDTSALFAPGGLVIADAADPHLLRPVRFIVGALQYAGGGTSLFEGADHVLDLLIPVLTSGSAHQRAPHVDLLRDLTANPDSLGTWLRPASSPDGSLLIGPFQIVPTEVAPKAIRSHALFRLEQQVADAEAWIALEMILGFDLLIGDDAERFDRATADADVPLLVRSLGEVAGIAVRRIARQASGEGHVARRAWLREALMTVSKRSAPRSPTPASPSRPNERTPRGEDGLTEWQSATIEALYLLSQAEPTPVDAMCAFTRDLASLSATDVEYLRAVRGVVERLVEGRSLHEALACLPLLVKARGT
jgi:hypothetical protein